MYDNDNLYKYHYVLYNTIFSKKPTIHLNIVSYDTTKYYVT